MFALQAGMNPYLFWVSIYVPGATQISCDFDAFSFWIQAFLAVLDTLQGRN